MNTRPKRLELFGETPFLPEELNFTIGKVSNTYTLKYSVDCTGSGDTNATWSNYQDETISANTVVFMKAPARVWWKLSGNTKPFVVRF